MALYNFQKRFAPPILSGEKRHTIRADRKDGRLPKPGELLHLYTGLRQKGAQLLMRVRCTRVEEITIYSNCRIAIAGVVLDLAEQELLARRDGFLGFPDMMVFWNGRRPFHGHIIHWHFPPDAPALPPSLHRLVMKRRTSQHTKEGQKVERSSRGTKLSPAVPVSGLPRARRRAEAVLQQQTPNSGLEGAQKAKEAPGMLP
ncbi:MAG: ASCH domain-containing protein [Terracidiphilus sp.]|nr:ASCH domain-containing protein [Terracidiphilus sp.]